MAANRFSERLPPTGGRRWETNSIVNLKENIRAHAAGLGFALCGFTSCEPPGHLAVYEAWVTAGRHAEMNYLATGRARTTRADPRLLMPACRTIIVLGCLYSPPAAPSQPLAGRVAAFALGDDYHDVLPARARALAGFILTQVGAPVQWRAVCDTAPLLEREIGQRAGLGWIGKNGMLISPQRGSYFVMAELLTSLDLPPDLPFEADRCGACRRCIEACPTACILPDRSLDAARCISYLTIENRNDIPEALRPSLGRWVFGCDVCQEVCPWNARFARTVEGTPLSPRPHFPLRDVGAELLADEASLAARFHRSPLRRARRAGWLRNLIVALGNTGSPLAVKALHHALVESDPRLRAHAAWALARAGGSSVEAALRAALEGEIDSDVRAALERALEHIRPPAQGPALATPGSG